MLVGSNSEQDFSMDNYEEFYEHHKFEPIPEDMAFTINEVIPRFGWALDKVEELGSRNILDLGCLDGSFALSVCDQLGIPVTGIDLTVDGINLAKERAAAKNLPATFLQGTCEARLEELAAQGKQYDVVTFFELIEHVEDVQRLIKLIDAVLAPGGSVLVSTPDFEGPVYGADDEINKCHIRLYTTAKKSYSRPNKFGTVRKATSIYEEIGEDRIKELSVHNHLINCRYQ